LILALGATYFIWGSTYLAIRFAIDSFPPFLMAGLRFLLAGFLLFIYLLYKGHSWPKRQEWLGAGVVGVLLLTIGNGAVTYAEQQVPSSLAALAIATVPIWMAVFSSLWGHHITVMEWVGITIGVVGIALLSISGTLHANPVGLLLLIIAAASWSLGSVWGKYLSMPKGLMASATQMLVGGFVLLVISMIWGEVWPQTISVKSWLAFVYLIVFGSIVAYTAYLYLLKKAGPLVASSNTFVNPIVALALGVSFAGEVIEPMEYVSLVMVIVAVMLILSRLNTE